MTVDSRTAIPSAVRLLGVIYADGDSIYALNYIRCDIHFERRVAIGMGRNLCAVDENLAALIYALEIKPKRFAVSQFQVCVLYLLAIPASSAREVTASVACGRISIWGMEYVPVVWKVNALPLGIIERGCLCTSHILLHELPTEVEVHFLTLAPCCRRQTG